jgi:hypothetical protein
VSRESPAGHLIEAPRPETRDLRRIHLGHAEELRVCAGTGDDDK